MITDPRGPQSSHFFEMEGWVPGIGFEPGKIRVRHSLGVFGQFPEEGPEFGTGLVNHRSVHFPVRISAKAASASASKRPARTSSSI